MQLKFLTLRMLGTYILILYWNECVELCDEIKEDGDILRLKDDFEFTSKNCSEGLMHLAHLIDQEEAIKLQRLGKPGQSSAGLNQSGGGLGARFS